MNAYIRNRTEHERRRQRAKHSDYGKPVILSLLSAGHSTTKMKKKRKKRRKTQEKKNQNLFTRAPKKGAIQEIHLNRTTTVR